MRRVIPITEQFQHFVEDLQGGFWGDCYGQVRRLCNEALECESIRLRELYLNCNRYERTPDRRDQRNGFYYRDTYEKTGRGGNPPARTLGLNWTCHEAA